MPNVVRGDRMHGLIAYLTGPGRANEHTEPRLVAGDGALMAWHGDAELNADSARRIAAHLDRPRRALGVEVTGGHVWHASLSLRVQEGQLEDERWGRIAEDFIAGMGFDDQDGSKAPCRWVAVHHGQSKAGNDHVHIAVNLVREDGTKASAHLDFPRAQRVARALEVKHGLERLESATTERSTRGYTPAEQARVQNDAERAARREHARENANTNGQPRSWEELGAHERGARVSAQVRLLVPRNALGLTVRGCASAAADEAEFVRRMRRAGVLVRPRFADGATDVVTGFSVAARPGVGQRPVWFGAGHLARDLSLPRLRGAWEDTPQGASAAVAEWTAAGRGRRVVAPGREGTAPDPQTWAQCAREVGELRERLRAVPLEDRATWADLARSTAGAFAAWSNAVEDEPGDLAAVAEVLSRSAQTHRREVPAQRAGMVSVGGAAMLLASVVRGGQGPVGDAALLRQLMDLSQAVHDAAKAGGQARHAQEIATSVRERLRRVHTEITRPHEAPRVVLGAGAGAPARGDGGAVSASVRAVLDDVERAEHARAQRPAPRLAPEVARRGSTSQPAERGVQR